MKNLILTIALGMAAVTAMAYEVIPVDYREFALAKAQISPVHRDSHVKVTNGSLKIGKKEVELTVNFKQNCPPNAMCIAVMPAPIFVKLPIVKIQKTSCGDVIVAKHDARPVDGALQMIEIRDFSNALCEIHVEHILTATYTTSIVDRRTGKDVTGVSLLSFDSLVYPLNQ